MQRCLPIAFLVLLCCHGTSRTINRDDSSNHLDQATEVVRSFLVWYKGNYPTVSSIPLVPEAYDADPKNVYHLNQNNLTHFLQSLRSSKMLSKHYLNQLENKIETCGNKIESLLLMDGPPGCMEGDQVLLTLEIEETIAKIDDLKILSSRLDESSHNAVVDVVLLYKLRFGLVLEDGNWLIDSIESK